MKYLINDFTFASLKTAITNEQSTFEINTPTINAFPVPGEGEGFIAVIKNRLLPTYREKILVETVVGNVFSNITRNLNGSAQPLSGWPISSTIYIDFTSEWLNRLPLKDEVEVEEVTEGRDIEVADYGKIIELSSLDPETFTLPTETKRRVLYMRAVLAGNIVVDLEDVTATVDGSASATLISKNVRYRFEYQPTIKNWMIEGGDIV